MANNIDVTLTIAPDAAGTKTTDPSGGPGTILSGATVYPLEVKDKKHGLLNAYKITFSLALPKGVSATITNFRYYNNGSNSASHLGWWSPDTTAPAGISSQPPEDTAARLPDIASDPLNPPSNPTGGAIKYQGVGSEFQWQTLNNNKLVIRNKNNNVMDYHYVVEFQITEPADLAGVYVHDPMIKNW
jgi:hypothetical protein